MLLACLIVVLPSLLFGCEHVFEVFALLEGCVNLLNNAQVISIELIDADLELAFAFLRLDKFFL